MEKMHEKSAKNALLVGHSPFFLRKFQQIGYTAKVGSLFPASLVTWVKVERRHVEETRNLNDNAPSKRIIPSSPTPS